MLSKTYLAKKHIFSILEKYASNEDNIVVALSGGADSLFLTIIASEWCKTTSKNLYAVTIDHQLRKESYLEAVDVGKIVRKHKVTHVIKRWNHGDIPDGQIEEKAREARYELLVDACRDLKSKILLIGHNLDEQIETYLIRKEKKSENFGLACMSESRYIASGIMIIRPCLPLSKNFIKSYLSSINERWVEDPMNSNECFIRVKKRKSVERLSDEQKRAMFDKIKIYGIDRNSTEREAVFFLQNHCQIHPYGFVDINLDFFYRLNEKVKCDVLKRCIKLVGRQEYKKSTNHCKNILAALTENNPINMGKCVIKTVKDKIRIFRENRNLEDIKIANKCGIWDNRFKFEVLEETILQKNCYIKPFNKHVSISDDVPSYITVTLPSLWIDKKMLYLYNVNEISRLIDFQFSEDIDFFSVFSCVKYDGGIL